MQKETKEIELPEYIEDDWNYYNSNGMEKILVTVNRLIDVNKSQQSEIEELRDMVKSLEELVSDPTKSEREFYSSKADEMMKEKFPEIYKRIKDTNKY